MCDSHREPEFGSEHLQQDSSQPGAGGSKPSSGLPTHSTPRVHRPTHAGKTLIYIK